MLVLPGGASYSCSLCPHAQQGRVLGVEPPRQAGYSCSRCSHGRGGSWAHPRGHRAEPQQLNAARAILKLAMLRGAPPDIDVSMAGF